MKNLLLISLITLTLSACTQLSAEDRAAIDSASRSAQAAERNSIQAAEDARRAREDANRAAISAQAASEKADRIFREGQNK